MLTLLTAELPHNVSLFFIAIARIASLVACIVSVVSFFRYTREKDNKDDVDAKTVQFRFFLAGILLYIALSTLLNGVYIRGGLN